MKANEGCKKFQLAYVVFGGKDEYIQETKFSILSARFHAAEDSKELLISICTDTPEKFEDLKDTNILYTETEKFHQWFGEDKYIYRAKPLALKSIISFAEKTILIDTDTIFKSNPLNLFEEVRAGSVLVDDFCGFWKNKKYSPLHEYLVENYPVGDDLLMVNSGLIGIVKEDESILDYTVDIIDDLYLPSNKKRTIEQFALAVAVHCRKFRLTKNNGRVKHYWSRKSIFQAIGSSWLEKHKQNYSSNEAREDFFRIQTKVPNLPVLKSIYVKAKATLLDKKIRRFYLELLKAIHDYDNEFYNAAKPVRIKKAIQNLKKRHLFTQQQIQEVLKMLRKKNYFSNKDYEEMASLNISIGDK